MFLRTQRCTTHMVVIDHGQEPVGINDLFVVNEPHRCLPEGRYYGHGDNGITCVEPFAGAVEVKPLAGRFTGIKFEVRWDGHRGVIFSSRPSNTTGIHL